MDDLDTVGKFGTISLIRKNTLEPITSYPVDDERTTFGRDPKCSIRMYFHAVDPLHCTLYFDDGKAYLEVHGIEGVTVDDVLISTGSTVPLNNASKFMIWRKLFSFNYPPREIRSKLMASPRKANSKSLRMSMIHSAVIMTPRAEPRHRTLDLQTLQSPLKPYKEAPNEIITFVDSDQIAVVEDNDRSTGAVPSGLFQREEEEETSLVALEEIDYDENAVEDPAFSRSPVKRQPTSNPFAPQSPLSSPSRTFTSASPRRLSNHVHVPPLSSIKSPVPTFLPPSGSPSAPRLLSPGRPLQSSSLVPRDQWRQAVASGFTPEPPRTPRRKLARMSMHKAVLVRSAHRVMIAAAKEREEKEEEEEVEEVVSPERKAAAPNFSPLGEEPEDDDAEGEEDFEMHNGEESKDSKVPPPAPAVFKVGASLFSSLSTFVRKSLSPERKTFIGPVPVQSVEQEPEDGEITEQGATGLSGQPSPADKTTLFRQTPPQAKLVFDFGVAPTTNGTDAQSMPVVVPQRSPTRPPIGFNFSPFRSLEPLQNEANQGKDSPVKSAEEDITDARASTTGGNPLARHNSNPFYTPQVTRLMPLQTNTAARPQLMSLDQAESPKLNSFWTKPIRPRKSMDLSASATQPVPALFTPQIATEDLLSVQNDDIEEESAKQERELRAQRRKSMLAAMDATPRRLADPSTRRSALLSSAFKRREGSLLPGSPSKLKAIDYPLLDDNDISIQPNKALLTSPENPPVAPEATLVNPNVDQAATRTILMIEEEIDVGTSLKEDVPVDALDILKANVDRARRESVRTARLSHGGGVLDGLILEEVELEESKATEPKLDSLLFTGYSQLLPVADATATTPNESAEGRMEIDITEAQDEVLEGQDHLVKQLMKVEDEVDEQDNHASQSLADRTPSPRRQAREPSPIRTTRGTKRGATVDVESSTVKRSTRRKVHGTEANDTEETAPEEFPRTLRRGRSATPAPVAIPEAIESVVPTPTARVTRRATSETPQSSTARSPSKSRSTKRKALAEPVIEEEDVEKEKEKIPKPAASTKPSKIATSKMGPTRPPSRNGRNGTGTKAKDVTPTMSTSSTRMARVADSIGKSAPSIRPGTIPRMRSTSKTTPAVADAPATRVKRSTRADSELDAEVEDSHPRKRRKAEAPVKEEEHDDPQPGRSTGKTRLPSALPTGSRRLPTITKRTPSNRKGSADHDKENTPETVQPEEQSSGKASVGKSKGGRPPVTTKAKAGTGVVPSKPAGVTVASASRSLRERGKK